VLVDQAHRHSGIGGGRTAAWTAFKRAVNHGGINAVDSILMNS
jgi:hypothetical protein